MLDGVMSSLLYAKSRLPAPYMQSATTIKPNQDRDLLVAILPSPGRPRVRIYYTISVSITWLQSAGTPRAVTHGIRHLDLFMYLKSCENVH
jgi:hypothetical protein